MAPDQRPTRPARSPWDSTETDPSDRRRWRHFAWIATLGALAGLAFLGWLIAMIVGVFRSSEILDVIDGSMIVVRQAGGRPSMTPRQFSSASVTITATGPVFGPRDIIQVDPDGHFRDDVLQSTYRIVGFLGTSRCVPWSAGGGVSAPYPGSRVTVDHSPTRIKLVCAVP